MKTILAFGDSLTWGADPATGGRHPLDDRWPSVLEAELDGIAHVIAEGLGGRTTSFDDHSAMAERNAVRSLPMLLASHAPLDLVIVMLGTNDLKPFINGHAYGAQAGMKRLAELVQIYPYGRGYAVPKILLVAPPHCAPTGDGSQPPRLERSIIESQKLAPLYAETAEAAGCAFFDAASVATASPIDGVHLDIPNTRAIGTGIAPLVRALLH